jgi:hypothetical protein
MPDYATYFSGRYINANLVEGLNLRPLTIQRIQAEEVENPDKPSEKKERMVIYFEGAKAGWLVNRTNAECLVALFGRRTEDWVGKRVALKSEMVRVGPTQQPGIRVHGSPDIDTDVKFGLRLPRKRPQPYTLKAME